MSDPDVLVIGAGPAGCIAALVLARAGVKVRLLDRASFPRDKLCGDTVNPGTLAILDGLGVSAKLRAAGLPIDGMQVTGPRGAVVVASYPPGMRGVALRRRELDMILLEAAVGAGADLQTGVVVREPILDRRGRVVGVRTSMRGRTGQMGAAFVVAADGRSSALGRTLRLCSSPSGPRRWAFGAYFEGVEGVTTFGEMHLWRDGYMGIARMPDGRSNVCLVRDWSFLRRVARGERHGMDGLIAAAIGSNPVLRARFSNARQATPAVALGPLAVEARGSGCPGLVLAGDAAGFIDPMTGDGLRFACRGGELAAHAVMGELRTGGAAFAALHVARRAEFAAKWRLNRALRRLVGSPRLLSCAERVAAHWTVPFEYLIARAGDLEIARAAVSPDLLPFAGRDSVPSKTPWPLSHPHS